MFSASKSGQYQGYQISRSVRFRASASAYFNRTFGTASGSTRGTWAGWVKRGQLSTLQYLWSASNFEFVTFLASDKLQISNPSGTPYWTTTMVFRDPSAWYHIVVAFDTTLATAADRCKLWVNGVQITQWDSNPTITQNATFARWNVNGQTGSIGRFDFNNTGFLDGYQTEIHWIDGQALTPSSFGVFNAYGVWSPIKYNGTYGNNGFYLNFNDNSGATATTIGKDSSGNGNNWTPNNISVTAGATYDSMLDVPTPWGDGGNGRGNYCVLNPLDTGGTAPSRANLELIAGAAERGVRSTFSIPTTGLWYVEALVGTNQTGSTDLAFGLVARTTNLAANPSGISNGWLCYATSTTNITRNGTSTLAGTGTALVSGDILQIAVDLANNKGWIGKNNTWFNGSTGTDGNPSTGANATFTFSSPPELFVLAHCFSSTINVNFGQRPFTYTPPTGFNALNTFNLPEPSIDNGRLYMAATTYTGTGASLSVNNTVNNVSFQPDFVWVKGRSGATDHALYDAVRGVQKQIESNTTTAETTETTGLTAFNSNGFTVGALAQMNTNTATYVGWQWNAGGSTVTNTSGSISAQVRASTTAGFSVVTYTGTGANATVGHGLGVAPSMILVKQRNGTLTWRVYHSSLANTQVLFLSGTDAATTELTAWNSTSPTSTVFSLGTGTGTNGNTNTYVAYCFAPITGFSRFGSYTGNGSADGPFVFTGFRPRWVMFKNASDGTTAWVIFDTARNTFNIVGERLDANSSAAASTFDSIDLLSNGFKLRASTGLNQSGNTIVYAAFAENPFKYSLAR